MFGKKKNTEFDITIGLTEGTLSEDGVLANAVILGNTSIGPTGQVKRRYTDQCLQNAVSIFEGAGAFVDHPKGRASAAHRSLRDMYGFYRNVRADLTEGKLFGDLVTFGNEIGQHVRAIIAANPKLVGNSIVAAGRGKRVKGVEVIEEIFPRTRWGTKATVDLVGDPATTKSLLEDRDTLHNKEFKMIELQNLTLTELREARPDLQKKLVEEGAGTRDTEIKDLKEQVEQLEKDKKNLTEEVSTLKAEKKEYEAATKKASKDALVTKLLAESKMPEKAITDSFKDVLTLVEDKEVDGKTVIAETQIKALIEDRCLLVGHKAPDSNKKKAGKERTGDDEHIPLKESKEVLASLSDFATKK
jgi:hypothetical protein